MGALTVTETFVLQPPPKYSQRSCILHRWWQTIPHARTGNTECTVAYVSRALGMSSLAEAESRLVFTEHIFNVACGLWFLAAVFLLVYVLTQESGKAVRSKGRGGKSCCESREGEERRYGQHRHQQLRQLVLCICFSVINYSEEYTCSVPSITEWGCISQFNALVRIKTRNIRVLF